MRFEVITTPYLDGRVEQEVFLLHMDNARDLLVRHVIDTQEAQVRAALIQLGWTPPGAVKS